MAVSFSLSPEQRRLVAIARRFAEEELRPLADEVRAEPDPLRRALLAVPRSRRRSAPASSRA
ncbi:hypothetical protein ACFQV8_21015 [Pseudonocardia benzenivorans]